MSIFQNFLASWVLLVCHWMEFQERYWSSLKSFAQGGTSIIHVTLIVTIKYGCTGPKNQERRTRRSKWVGIFSLQRNVQSSPSWPFWPQGTSVNLLIVTLPMETSTNSIYILILIWNSFNKYLQVLSHSVQIRCVDRGYGKQCQLPTTRWFGQFCSVQVLAMLNCHEHVLFA